MFRPETLPGEPAWALTTGLNAFYYLLVLVFIILFKATSYDARRVRVNRSHNSPNRMRSTDGAPPERLVSRSKTTTPL
jgi:hypothetical protein